MINELHGLALTLDNMEIPTDDWHQEYKELPQVTGKSPCVRIWLADDGTLHGFESLTSEQVRVLRKYGSNQNSFPAFNISSLYRIIDASYISELEKYEKGQEKPDIERIKLWCSNDNWGKGIVDKVRNSLTQRPQKLLEILEDQGHADGNAVTKLIKLCGKLYNEIDGGFRGSLEKFLFEKIQQSEDVSLALALLFHKGSAPKAPEKDVGDNISVILDLYNWQTFGYPIACEHTTRWLNGILLENNRDKLDMQKKSCAAKLLMTDAFGTLFVNPDEPMPNVKLSGFDVTLRSMFSGQPCQYRYDQIDDASYPISAGNRSQIKKALEWMADSSRRGITWEKVEKNEIVFVYPSKLPKVSPRFASILGNSSADGPTRTVARFENVAKEFTKSFRGLPGAEKPDSIQIFSLRKIDKARRKVVFTHNSTPELLIKAAENWSNGCHNLPELRIGEHTAPFPLEVAEIVNKVWKQNGERADGKTPVNRMKYYQGMELLLDIMEESMLRSHLHITLVNSSGLINYLGNFLHGGGKYNDSGYAHRLEKLKSESVLVFSVLGLLLYKCNQRKENYMGELAYLVGQLLHVSDELHTLYCHVERDGDIPPQLAGNALFVTAGDMPYQAIAQLATRMNPYISWAKQYRYMNIIKKHEESWKANWLLGLFEITMDRIWPVIDRTSRFDDYQKAQLFIGYMASLPKKEIVTVLTNTGENENRGGSNNE